MNFQSIIEEIEKIDPDFQDRISPRRSAIKNITSFGSKIAAAAVPFYLGTMFNKVYAQTATIPALLDILNYALKLEFLEYEYYNTGVNTPGLIPTGSGMTALSAIRDHESAHVNFLINTIKSLQLTPVSRASQGYGPGTNPAYDFSGGSGVGLGVAPGVGTGPFNGVFQNYDAFLALAQVFEDTGVRAYKGQAGNVVANNTGASQTGVPQVALGYALRIHSVEARHAAHLRQMRRARAAGGATAFLAPGIKPWITSTSANGANDTGIAAANGNYMGEDLAAQAGFTLTGATVTYPVTAAYPAQTITISATAATEQFDEPLTMAQVLPLVTIFGIK